MNDTLSAYGCPKAGDSTSETTAWTNVFAPAIAERINSEAPGANLNNEDIVNLMSLCPFDTVAYERPSRWCYLFTLDEWASYSYVVDLGFYYYTGYVLIIIPPWFCRQPLMFDSPKTWADVWPCARGWVRE